MAVSVLFSIEKSPLSTVSINLRQKKPQVEYEDAPMVPIWW